MIDRQRWRSLRRVVLVLALLAAAAPTHGDYTGKPFPSFEAKDALTGKRFKLEDLRGKVVLIDFWATWCGPCVKEVPNVRRVHQKYKDKGFEVVSISLDKSRSKCHSYVKKNKMAWYHVMEGGGWKTRLAKKYRIRSIPAMFLIDHEGVCISDSARGSSLEKLVAAAVRDAPSSGRRGGDSEDKKPPATVASADRLETEMRDARANLDDIAAPLDELDASLASARLEIEALEDPLLEIEASERTLRKYERLRADLARVRCQLFVCGALGKRIPLPETVLLPDKPAVRADYARAAGQLPVAMAAVEVMQQELDRVRNEVDDMSIAIEKLARGLESGGSSSRSFASRGKATLEASEALVARCRTAWQRQIDAASAIIERLGEPVAEGSSEFDSIETRITQCREQLEGLAFGDVEPSTVRDNLGGICDELSALAGALAARDVEGVERITLPKNVLDGASSRDMRARIDAAVQLDRAADAVTAIKTLSAGAGDHGDALALRQELEALREAAHETSDAADLRALELEFVPLADRVLELRDRFAQDG